MNRCNGQAWNASLFTRTGKISKAFVLHAMETLGGRDITPTHSRPWHWMGVSGQRHAPTAIYPCRKDPGTYWTGG
jgi:hypothetical protein